MKKLQVGDHVELKGFILTGYSGTIISRSRVFRIIRVRLDDGQLRGGNNIVRVSKMNIVKK